jgi:hypothetical protein
MTSQIVLNDKKEKKKNENPILLIFHAFYGYNFLVCSGSSALFSRVFS